MQCRSDLLTKIFTLLKICYLQKKAEGNEHQTHVFSVMVEQEKTAQVFCLPLPRAVQPCSVLSSSQMFVILGSVVAQLGNLEKVLGVEGEVGLCPFARSLVNSGIGLWGERRKGGNLCPEVVGQAHLSFLWARSH